MSRFFLIAVIFLNTSVGVLALDTTKSLFVDAISQVIRLSKICGTYEINNEKLLDVMQDAGIKGSDIAQDGEYLGPFLYGRNLANEIGADMSMKGTCYHLKIRFGPEGETIPNLVRRK